MGFTPKGFPYPEGTDSIGLGDNVIKALAEAVDTYFTSLPTGGTGGGGGSYVEAPTAPTGQPNGTIWFNTSPAV